MFYDRTGVMLCHVRYDTLAEYMYSGGSRYIALNLISIHILYVEGTFLGYLRPIYMNKTFLWISHFS